MEELEISGKTVEEAVEAALDELGLSESEVKIEVVQEGKRSILGWGGEDALIRVTPLKSPGKPLKTPATTPAEDEADPELVTMTAREITEKLLSLMGMSGSVKPVPPQDSKSPPGLEITNDNPGMLIGRRGQALAALQYMVNFLTSRQLKSGARVIIDVAGYRQRRQEEIRSMALRVADLVKTNRHSITMEPMGAWERRIVHLTLRNEKDVSTGSVGFGERRKVVVSTRKH